VAAAVALCLLPLNSRSAETGEYYCIQVASSPELNRKLVKEARRLREKFPAVRIERIEKYYTLRVGFWEKADQARPVLRELKSEVRDAFLRRCLYKPERWVYPEGKREEKKEVVQKPTPPQRSRRPELTWEKEFEEVVRELQPRKPQIPLPEKTEEKPQKREEEKPRATTYKSQVYLFVDGFWIEGLDPKDECRRRGREVTARLGYRFAFDAANRVSIWGDIFGGVGYQKFNHTSRRKGWWDVRYLYLLTRTIERRKYPGFDLTLGRLPVLEPRGFWYRNYLDGLRLRYQSTLLKGYLFLGTRFKDMRVSTSEEKINLDGYKYLIGRLDYQYYYRRHLGLFFVKEYKKRFSNLESPDAWDGVRPKGNQNWIGLRLTGEDEGRKYWLDLSYTWGRRGFTDTNFVGCTADKEVVDAFSRKVHGFGGELGYRKVWGGVRKKGLGFRIAVGQGSSHRGGINFNLPRISTLMEPLFGPNRIRYYGELTNPDLNNLVVLSLFGGKEIRRDTWLEFNLLKYFQYNLSPYGPFSRYFIGPNGRSRDLGYELDLFLDGEVVDDGRWRYLITGSLFIPGGAYSGLLENWEAYGISLRLKRYW